MLLGRTADSVTIMPAAIRLLQYAAVTGLIGAVTFRIFLLPAAGLMPTVHQRVAAGVRRFTLLMLLLLLGALALRLWTDESLAAAGAGSLGELAGLLTRQTWGQAWLAQVGACLIAAVAALTGLSALVTLAALVLPAGLAFQAHGAALAHLRTLAIAADALHVLAAGAWVGTLAVLLTTAMPALFRGGIERGGHDTARVLDAFAPVAATAILFLAGAGAVSAAVHFHSVTEFVTTRYGRTLLLKLGLVLLTLVSGWYWGRARPALPLHRGVRALRRGAGLQLFFAAAALAASAAMGALPPP